MPRGDDPLFDVWVDRANATPMLEAAILCGAKMKKVGTHEYAGPCPRCGGKDRFSINIREKVWNCRNGGGGNNPIDMVKYAKDCDFLAAVETLTGQKRPERKHVETAEERDERKNREREIRAERDREEAEAARMRKKKRQRDEEAIADVLERAEPASHPRLQEYLASRSIAVPGRFLSDIRYVAELDYFGFENDDEERPHYLASLPAMVALIRNVMGDIVGIHQTYLDPNGGGKWTPPDYGLRKRENPVKKVRGQQIGGMIRLGIIGPRLALGEGIETVLSWWALGFDRGYSLATALNLNNMAGKCTGSLLHPIAKARDGKPLRYANGIPHGDEPGVIIPDDVREVLFLGDGTSEVYETRGRLSAAVRRAVAQNRQAKVHRAPPGEDWNDVLKRRGAFVEDAA